MSTKLCIRIIGCEAGSLEYDGVEHSQLGADGDDGYIAPLWVAYCLVASCGEACAVGEVAGLAGWGT